MRFPLCLLFFLLTSYSYAGGGMAPPRGGPPPEALSACQQAQEGSKCSFRTPRGNVSGQCLITPQGKMACVPEGMGQGAINQDRGMPPSGNRTDSKQPISRTLIGGENPAAIVVKSRVPDTHQGDCFNNQQKIPCPQAGEAFYGQDAQYLGAEPNYQDNGDGTITDLVTGLIWEQAHHSERLGYYAAKAECENLQLGGRNDWRLPAIKELYSIIDFRGAAGIRPYLNDVFEIHQPASLDSHDQFASTHSPDMMGQTWSSTIYTGEHYGRPGVEAAFFVNFLDGRIKQAPTSGRMGLFYRCVAGSEWGDNQFVANYNVVEDRATGLMWQKQDDGQTRNWSEALAYCENLNLDGHQDWRLPNAKELESIVDYSHHLPALDQRYLSTSDAKAWYWSSTTLGDSIRQAVYVCFGPCVSVDNVDVHGAGAARSDPKAGNPDNFGPMGGQRDEVRINNLVRCVR